MFIRPFVLWLESLIKQSESTLCAFSPFYARCCNGDPLEREQSKVRREANSNLHLAFTAHRIAIHNTEQAYTKSNFVQTFIDVLML